jgi:hypothetical protein
MSTAAVKEVVEQIRRLTPEERSALAHEVSPMLDEDYHKAIAELRASAERDGITEADIDRAVEKVRYGK